MLTIDKINQVKDIFTKQGWEIEKKGNTFNYCLFDDFCETLDLFSTQQQDLILVLTREFLEYPVNRYIEGFVKAFDSMIQELSKKINRIFITPLLSEGDIGSAKSGPTFFYIIEAQEKLISKKYEGISLIYINNLRIDSDTDAPRGLPRPRRFNKQNNSIILLVDDFIGTGTTAASGIKYMTENIGYSRKKVFILTLVAQEQGISHLKSIGAKCFPYILRNKGITDNYTSPIKEQHLSTMEEIENLINVEEIFRYGYKRSEALVKVAKVPNNTFPVYWYKSTLSNGKKFIGPLS